ncbi:TIGR02300 family protein [Bartonella sp. TP]|uniref:TIGR02300 family protein n=1 Tax=Bartonella sp. TP TaxID=3057550 RepID=UPI0025B0FE5D|nr:TIGR02300 family protein [Bartonella sp. TP]MDN5248613.1 TIGR02300 family protein [Alphaproteobacteria bacterium]WJW80432.1 TIGR02300 family protein [Bartonella sp. TP]
MVKTKLGTKRVDPETGRKFYDLGRDPVVSPYTGKSYPLSYFESTVIKPVDEDLDNVDELDSVLGEPEFLPLEDGVEDDPDTADLPDLDDDDVTIEDDDVFLADADDDVDEDMQDIIGTPLDEEDEDM